MKRDAHQVLTLGSDPALCDLVVLAPGVDPLHCRITYDDTQGSYLVEDLGSSTGTFLEHHHLERLVPGVAAEILLNYKLYLGPEVWVPVTTTLLRKLIDPDGFEGPRMVQGHHVARQEAEVAAPTPHFEGSGHVYRIGRDPACDVPLAQPNVSRRHLEVEPDRSGMLYRFRDLGSVNGLSVDRPGTRVPEAIVGLDAVLYLGTYRLPVSLVHQALQSRLKEAESIRLPVEGTVLIGRKGGGGDLEVDSPVVSRLHAEVRVSAEGVWIRDLGSDNGTFVRGQRVRLLTRVQPEDEVSLGGYRIRLVPGEALRHRTYDGPVTLDVHQVSRMVTGNRAILDGVSLTVFPTELVGLMGPSGAGKTTLLQAMNGYAPPEAGQVRVNGHDFYSAYSAYKGDIGYVPQDDIVFSRLTVHESLRFSARLRLPEDTRSDEIDRRIETLLQRLQIEQTQHVLIGDALDKGISGGQRKRVNLAQELLTEPSLLFLDEPTSGLASEDTIEVMRLLRELANDGRTVVLTIHQPSLEVYKQMDNVIYLFEGRLVYYGPAHPDSIAFMNGGKSVDEVDPALLGDPGQALKPLAQTRRNALAQGGLPALQQEADRLRQTYEASAYHEEYVAKRRQAKEGEPALKPQPRAHRTRFLHQLSILAERTLLIKRRDKANTAILLAQAPIVAFVLGLVFQPKMGALPWAPSDGSAFSQMDGSGPLLFLLAASAIWFGAANAAREIVAEQLIYVRERMVNLRIDAYIASKFAVLGALGVVQCTALLSVVWWMLEMPTAGAAEAWSFMTMLFTLILCAWAGTGMGLLLSSVVRSGEAAVALVPILLIPQIVLGGLLVPGFEQRNEVRALADLTALRWGFEALLHTAYADETTVNVIEACLEEDVDYWNLETFCCIRVDRRNAPPPRRLRPVPNHEHGIYALESFCDEGEVDSARVVDDAIPWDGVDAEALVLQPRVKLQDEPICEAFCRSIQQGRAITALDRALGPHLGPDSEHAAAHETLRRDVERWLPAEARGALPDTIRSATRSRGARHTAWWVLLGMTALLLSSVGIVLRVKDPLPR